MKTYRYNAFEFIHKALRAMMYETALTLQQTDFTIDEECNTAISKVNFLLENFSSHAHHENNHVVPAISKFDKQLADNNLREHEHDEVLTTRIKEKINLLQKAYPSEEKKMAGYKLILDVQEFIAFNLTHMNEEETAINEILWKNYSDEELLSINDTIRKQIPQQEMMQSLKWMFRGMNNPEIIFLFSELKKGMPPPAFEAVSKMAEDQVSSSRWKYIREEMKEGSPA